MYARDFVFLRAGLACTTHMRAAVTREGQATRFGQEWGGCNWLFTCFCLSNFGIGPMCAYACCCPWCLVMKQDPYRVYPASGPPKAVGKVLDSVLGGATTRYRGNGCGTSWCFTCMKYPGREVAVEEEASRLPALVFALYDLAKFWTHNKENNSGDA
eukprot:2989394-Pyramimonas_sp.AAC.1